ncbi:hypothetical protein J3T65_11285 [Staphylococcus simiae]|uniref:hypothetical protein n=1 Tax=Staphylococcus simiae TaxID=308354 RepID=UPI001A95A9D8|nr:hypothetical protein [Staphylococcus simiae]MBO1199920.1 hypothetical protein [Staphylococcus simiae]MBO1202192.1 hypothetical protein [Staphylococcus simiae]MBO1204452.1 hypothetical protein [Staphylococcus simiae]MBO1211990.1 hypothetical protein [Staphylococcus simiae]MBO1230637.1 hypothetical protein [Staphylococcus simiae]
MTFKNIFLSIVAVLLTICLIMLLFLATNQDALAKVHQTINTFSKFNALSHSTGKENFNLFDMKTAKASEIDKTNKQHNKVDIMDNNKEFAEQECHVIATNYVKRHVNDTFYLKDVKYTDKASNYIYSNGNKADNKAIKVTHQGILQSK